MSAFTSSAPASVPATAPIVRVIARLASGFVAGLSDFSWLNAAMNRRLSEVEQLRALSDEDLAARGLTRDDIVRHVFRDLMHAC